MFEIQDPEIHVEENATQFPGDILKKDILDLVIGFDWGTSATKVAIQMPYHSGRRTYAVDFGSLSPAANPFLLPSVLYFDVEDKASLRESSGVRSVVNTKLRLSQEEDLSNGEIKEAAVEACVFAACVLRYVRYWFMNTYARAYHNPRLRWSLNLGIPSDGHENQKLRDVYQKIAVGAWHLSTEPGPVNLSRAIRILKRNDVNDVQAVDIDQIEIIPEVAAQVVGYAKSSLRRNGMHMLVDVGAMTVDVASFNLLEDQQSHADLYRFFTADVKPYGAYKLHEKRVLDLLDALENHRMDSETYARLLIALRRLENPLRSIPTDLQPYLSAQLRSLLIGPNGSDDAFAECCRQMIHAQIRDLRKNKYPQAPAWKHGLPIFLCGGGHTISPYQRALKAVSQWWNENTQVAPFQIRSLPTPINLVPENMDSDTYHRVSVAYGLSFPVDDIGGMRPAGDVSDVNGDDDPKGGGFHEDMKDLM